MGTFGEWQPQYAERGIATFPVSFREGRKIPAIKSWQRTTLRSSRAFAAGRFAENEALGLLAGRSSGLTILDVDTTEERVFRDALDRHGASPVLVRTASGKWHGYYRYCGEDHALRRAGRNRVRPWPNLPIDLLAEGYAVAAPSVAANGQYQWIQGGLDDLRSLPSIQNLGFPDRAPPTSRENSPSLGELNCGVIKGERNNSLFKYCMRQAHSCGSLDKLLELARIENARFVPPQDEREVFSTAQSAWGYTERGKNFVGLGNVQIVSNVVVDSLAAEDPFAFALWMVLRRYHWGHKTFALAAAMAKETLRWDKRRFLKARERLVVKGMLRCIEPGGRGPNDPPIFAFT